MFNHIIYFKVAPPQASVDYLPEPYPHMCFMNVSGDRVCEVYTEFYSIKLNLGLRPTLESDDNSTDDTCKYPFGTYKFTQERAFKI